MITRTPPTTTILVFAVVCALAGSIIRAAGLGRVVRTATPLAYAALGESVMNSASGQFAKAY